MMNISSFDHDFLLSDYEMDDMDGMDDMEYSPSPLVMHPDINIMSSPSIPSNTRTNNCCGHDPYFNIMEICQFCNNEICSSCRIKSNYNHHNNKSLLLSQQNHNTKNNKTRKINKSHDYDPHSYSQSHSQFNDHDIIEKYQCKACTIKKEEEFMSDVISSALTENKHKLISSDDEHNEVHIISIIAQYSVGHIIKCCDNTRNCTNNISISNRFDFESELIDSDNHKIVNTSYETYNESSSECEHASIQSEMNMNSKRNIQHTPNISHANNHRHAMNIKQKKSQPRKQNKHHQKEIDTAPALREPKQMNSNYVDIYGQRRTVFCNDCHDATRSESNPTTTTPFMMLMATKRFQKNQFGVYE